MENKKDTDYFWVGYTDLMTSLFFIMLVLYVLTFAILKFEKEKYKADAEQLRKIREIEESVNKIDTSFFIYNEQHKKHILNISISFENGRADIAARNDSTILLSLIQAGRTIIELVNRQEENIKYLVIIEGQASNDRYAYNHQLSYERALSLFNFWKERDIDMGNNDKIELIIAGSGTGGIPRELPDRPPNNQRFLIHIIPKIGEL